MFAEKYSYTRFGKFLRKYKLDELPQLWNILKGDMVVVGPRPEEKRTLEIIPGEITQTILSVKPGLTSPASLHFYDEEKILQESKNKDLDFWVKIKPMKILLDTWYVQNKNWMLDLGLIWATLKKIILK